MKICVPKLGTNIKLRYDWFFSLHNENRNATLWDFLKTKNPFLAWPHRDKPQTVKLLADSVLVFDRYYIRKNAEEFDSITFRLVSYPGEPVADVRFWVSLCDVDGLEAVKVTAVPKKGAKTPADRAASKIECDILRAGLMHSHKDKFIDCVNEIRVADECMLQRAVGVVPPRFELGAFYGPKYRDGPDFVRKIKIELSFEIEGSEWYRTRNRLQWQYRTYKAKVYFDEKTSIKCMKLSARLPQ